MKRLLLTLLVFGELVAGAAVGVAVAYGRFDLPLPICIYLLGPIVVIALGAGLALPTPFLSKFGTHGLLLLGCVTFALPFVWLVSTSFKYEEEIFVYPPKWVPSAPATVTRSPYLCDEELPRVERPQSVPVARWDELRPKLEAAGWDRARHLLGEGRASMFDAELTRRLIVRALWGRAVSSAPMSVSGQPDSSLIRTISGRIDAESVDAAWGLIHRAVMVRDLAVTDDEGIMRKPAGAGVFRALDGCGRCTRESESSPITFAYDLSDPNLNSATFVAEFPLPIPAGRFFSLTIPMRQDRSWNAMKLAVEVGGVRYVPEDALYLGQRRWQELTFKLKHKDARDERDVAIFPLVRADDQSNVYNHPDAMRVSLSIERATRAAAMWRKFVNNYLTAYRASGQGLTYLYNSLYLVVLRVIGQVLSCSMVAYAFARLRWPGRDAIFLLLLATMMLPHQVTMVPTFVIFKHLGWYNTLRALWAPSFLGGAFFIFMLRQFMRSLPAELEEAARIDGCGFFGIYWRIILPLVKPALAAVAVFTFMGTWNDFIGPLIYISDQRLYPLSLGLFDFRTQHGADYGMLMAASTLMTLPVIAIFFLAQRYFIQGVTLTGMKG